MVFEGRIAEMLQNQASRFLRGFSAEQLRIGLISGRLELHSLALNPEPLDALLLESEIPLMMKAGVLMSAVVQLSLLQGELELVIDGLILVLGPTCRWLTRAEVYSHRLNEIQRLEFVHMRSQCQRRTLEREMFRQLFADYLSRLKITIRNVHVRVEVDREMDGGGSMGNASAVFGMIVSSCEILPMKDAVTPPKQAEGKDAHGQPKRQETDPSQSELLLAERVSVKGLSLYHEMGGHANIHIGRDLYYATKNHPLGAFEEVKQDHFVRLMHDSQGTHARVPLSDQLMPPTSFSVSVDLRSQPIRDGFHVDSCLTMEITVMLEGGPSRLQFSLCTIDHLQWFVRRALDFQLWQYMHPLMDQPRRAAARWAIVRSCVSLKRRIHGNTYALSEAITMRIHCKEYVRLYKKKFNGPQSVVAWRKSMPPLTHGDAVRLGEIELVYPADKLVNFRLMAHAELKTEMALNSFLNSEESYAPQDVQHAGGLRRAGRELTPLEQIHLHGQHGYGVNIYRGLPPPPSSLKIRIDVQAPLGLWWVCALPSSPSQVGARTGGASGKAPTGAPEGCWAIAADCTAQPLRVLLVDSVIDASVFATVELPAPAAGERPLALLLGRTTTAFASGSPGRGGHGASASSGGRGPAEWVSVFEFCGAVYCCSQLKTVLTASPSSPWDIFVHLSCGEAVDASVLHGASGFGRLFPLDGGGPTSSTAQLPPLRMASDTSNTGSNVCLKLRLPLTMASGQVGPFAEMLKSCVGAAKGSAKADTVLTGAAHSAIAWFARKVSVSYDIALFRLHLRLPPLVVEGGGQTPAQMRLPRFDMACHLEHGGLVDGFVVGLHQLRHFANSFLTSGLQVGEKSSVNPINSAATGPSGFGGGSTGLHRRGMGNIPLSLQQLEQSPPMSMILSALLCAYAVVLAARSQAGHAAKVDPSKAVLLAQQMGFTNCLGPVGADSPASLVSLILVLLAVAVSRRFLWDLRDSKLGGRLEKPSDQEGHTATQAITDVHRTFGSLLRVILALGFPLHPRCLPLAAWAGAVEILEATAASSPAPTPWPPAGLVIWAARGAFANLQHRQDQVLRWLIRQNARIDERDKGGRSLLEWACWGGAEELVNMAMRAGLLPPVATPRREALGLGDQHPAASISGAPLPPPQLPTHLPALTFAVAGRCAPIVTSLLRAACDPHSPQRCTGCGPLLLAVRNCEYELGCEVLRSTPFVAVDAALGPHLPTSPSAQAASGSSSPSKGDNGLSGVGCAVRATVAIVDSLRRFAGALARRSAEDGAPHGHGGLRAHSPGPHPDEGLYATGQLPFSDILHPLVAQFPMPINKVHADCRPHHPPHRWLKKNGASPWAPAHLFVECCLKRGFKPDAAVISRALPALPPEARRLVQHLVKAFPALPPPPSPGGDLDFALHDRQQPTWLGSVYTTDDRLTPRNGSRPTGPSGSEEMHAAISFAKEIRQLRGRSGSGIHNDGVPPIDLAAALGVSDDAISARESSPLHRRMPTSMPNARGFSPPPRHGGGRHGGVFELDMLPSGPAAWLSFSNGSAAPVGAPLPLDVLTVDGAGITWSGPRMQPRLLPNRDVGALRRFELSGADGGAPTKGKYVVEVRLAPEADTAGIMEAVLGGAHVPSAEGRGRWQAISIAFVQLNVADSFASALQATWMSNDGMPRSSELHDGQLPDDVAKTDEEVAAFLSGGPWDPSPILPDFANEVSGEATQAPSPAPLAVRVLVLGSPKVGKSRVASCLLAELTKVNHGPDIAKAGGSDGYGPAWLRVSSGLWPKSGKPRAEVHVWDGAAAPLPGLMERLVESSVPTLIIVVADSALMRIGAPSDSILATFTGEHVPQSSAPGGATRRVLVVENQFVAGSVNASNTAPPAPPAAPPPPPASTPAARQGRRSIKCSVTTSDGAQEVRKACVASLSEVVAETEALASRSGTGAAPQPATSLGAGSAVARACALSAAPDPRGDRALGARLGADSGALLSPAAIAWAWTCIRSAFGTLSEGTTTAETGGGLVPWERLERVLSSCDGGGDDGPSPMSRLLLRALTDLALVCPVPGAASPPASAANDAGGGVIGGVAASRRLNSGWALLPDLARRVRLAAPPAPSNASGTNAASNGLAGGQTAKGVNDVGTKAAGSRGDGTSSGSTAVPGGNANHGNPNGGRAGSANDSAATGAPTAAASSGGPVGSANVAKVSGVPAPAPLSARIVWDSTTGPPPLLRTAIRDLLARGSLGNQATERCVEVRRFVLLESGPSGSPGPTCLDGLAPGFLLVFDLVPMLPLQSNTEDMPMVCQGSPASKPPTSLRATPSGSPAPLGGDSVNEGSAASQVTANDFGHAGDDDAAAASLNDGAMQRYTTVLVGVSYDGKRSNSKEGYINGAASGATSGSGIVFWDVHVSGPHAHWAWRALLGTGACGPSFASFRRNAAAATPSKLDPVTALTSNAAWPVPPPTCLISTSASSGGAQGAPNGVDFASHSWLFNGPQAAGARGVFVPQGVFHEAIGGGVFAECCAALCGKKPPSEDVVSGLEEDGDVEGLVSCADFEASMLARSWRLAPKLLEEALAAGVEAWALCFVSLARVAHDMAAAAAGARGRALPLLVVVNSSNGAAAGSLKAAGAAPIVANNAVALVPEGPPPLVAGPSPPHQGAANGAANGHALMAAPLGMLTSSPGVQAWLRVCRPAALWSAAGSTRGFTEKPLGDEQLPATPGAAGALVVEALQAALAAPLNEQMVNEVWEALAELEASAMSGGKGGDACHSRTRLVRRACGTWARVASDGSNLVL